MNNFVVSLITIVIMLIIGVVLYFLNFFSKDINAIFFEVPEEVILEDGKNTTEIEWGSGPSFIDKGIIGCSNISDGGRNINSIELGSRNKIDVEGIEWEGVCAETPGINDDDVWSQCFTLPKKFKDNITLAGDDTGFDVDNCSISFKAIVDCNAPPVEGQ